jgi:predicted  nucleic acid-binding Zn-ribbon protein
MSKSTVVESKQNVGVASAVSTAVKAAEQQRVELAALRQRTHTSVQQSELHQEIEAAKAKLDQFNDKVYHKLDEWEQHIDADIARLDAKIGEVTERTKAAIDEDIAAANEEEAKFRSEVKATFTARLNDLKADVDALKAKVDTKRGEAKAKWDGRVAELQAQQAVEEERVAQLDKAQGEAWELMSKRVRKAIAGYQKAVRTAESEYAKGE